ncbi:MAG TPA: hypothetical protein VHM91_13670 [Verrucomicrobiales bacterium]|nr:hypothetical protein [Verrucomicrobiales bacterium]
MDKRLQFLDTIKRKLPSRTDWIDDALRAAVRLPEELTVEEAADAFLRWYCDAIPLPQDQPVLDALSL